MMMDIVSCVTSIPPTRWCSCTTIAPWPRSWSFATYAEPTASASSCQRAALRSRCLSAATEAGVVAPRARSAFVTTSSDSSGARSCVHTKRAAPRRSTDVTAPDSAGRGTAATGAVASASKNAGRAIAWGTPVEGAAPSWQATRDRAHTSVGTRRSLWSMARW